jgi:hypothetical protein
VVTAVGSQYWRVRVVRQAADKLTFSFSYLLQKYDWFSIYKQKTNARFLDDERANVLPPPVWDTAAGHYKTSVTVDRISTPDFNSEYITSPASKDGWRTATDKLKEVTECMY